MALALRGAAHQATDDDDADEGRGRAAALAMHRHCVNRLADALETRFGRMFNRRNFLREAGLAETAPRKEGATCRVHCLRESYDVYIGRGRGGIWGNPFSHLPNTLAEFRVASRDEAVDKHLAWLRTQPKLLGQLRSLKGKRLGCFCEADERCHGDNIIRLIEETTAPETST